MTPPAGACDTHFMPKPKRAADLSGAVRADLRLGAARVELEEFLIELERRHELTLGESVQLLGERVAMLAKYVIQRERTS